MPGSRKDFVFDLGSPIITFPNVISFFLEAPFLISLQRFGFPNLRGLHFRGRGEADNDTRYRELTPSDVSSTWGDRCPWVFHISLLTLEKVRLIDDSMLYILKRSQAIEQLAVGGTRVSPAVWNAMAQVEAEKIIQKPLICTALRRLVVELSELPVELVLDAVKKRAMRLRDTRRSIGHALDSIVILWPMVVRVLNNPVLDNRSIFVEYRG